MKDQYIYEKPGAVGTTIELLALLCAFVGMLVGYFMFSDLIGGFLAGIALFMSLSILYLRFDRSNKLLGPHS